MYINPFLAGFMTAIFIELALIFVFAVFNKKSRG